MLLEKKDIQKMLEDLPDDVVIEKFGYRVDGEKAFGYEMVQSSSQEETIKGILELIGRIIMVGVTIGALHLFKGWYGFEYAVFLGIAMIAGLIYKQTWESK